MPPLLHSLDNWRLEINNVGMCVTCQKLSLSVFVCKDHTKFWQISYLACFPKGINFSNIASAITEVVITGTEDFEHHDRKTSQYWPAYTPSVVYESPKTAFCRIFGILSEFSVRHQRRVRLSLKNRVGTTVQVVIDFLGILWLELFSGMREI